MRIRTFVASSLVLAACGVTPSEEGDAEHDRFVTGGKADTAGIEEGTAAALGVLHVVNVLGDDALRTEVGLATNAATNIGAYKRGDDEVAGTGDDERFETLAELDSIPFVGPVAFGKLLAYAEAEGFTDDPPPVSGSDDPFDPNACAGAPMSQAAAHARWQSGNGVLGSYQIAIRRRSCAPDQDPATCGPWTAVDLGTISWRTKADGQLKLAKYGDSIRLQTVHALCYEANTYLSPAQYVDGAVCSGVGHTLYCGTYAYPGKCKGAYSPSEPYELPNGKSFAFEGKLTENCAQLRDSTNTLGGNQFEVAILTRF